MKNFVSYIIAAILGSAITIVSFKWFYPENQSVKIEHVDRVPSAQAGFYVNESGETVALDFTDVADKVTKAVTHIRSTSESSVNLPQGTDPFQFFFGPQNPNQLRPTQSTGSGVIINPNGYIATNNHVVEGADKIEVTLNDNRTFVAEVVGSDKDTDLAILKIGEKDLPSLSFVNSDKAKVGQWVLAVGNPFNLTSTVTAGIISAKGRNIGIIGSNETNSQAGRTAIESFIQTDAAINPGNSGGALVNLNGELLGINTAIASSTGTYAGYGFAVPSNIVSKVVDDLLTYGTVQRGWLGVQVQNVDSDLAREKDLAVKEGAYVADFAETSAAKDSGIKVGDVVVKLDSTKINSSTGLIEYIGQKRPGDRIKVIVNRDGKEHTYEVVLKNKEGKIGVVKPEEKSVASIGLEVEDAKESLLKRLDLEYGVRVKNVGKGKISRYTDMKIGFIITKVDETPVKSARDVEKIIDSKKDGELITFSGVYEGNQREYIYAVRK